MTRTTKAPRKSPLPTESPAVWLLSGALACWIVAGGAYLGVEASVLPPSWPGVAELYSELRVMAAIGGLFFILSVPAHFLFRRPRRCDNDSQETRSSDDVELEKFERPSIELPADPAVIDELKRGIAADHDASSRGSS